MKRSLALSPLLLSLLIVGCSSSASLVSEEVEAPAAEVAGSAEVSIDYSPYAEVLATYVDADGLVDYEALQANRATLDEFVASLGAIAPSEYARWSEADRIALLINAYNAFTLQSISDTDPIADSIRDIPGVWRGREFAIVGSERTLDAIEHGILREEFNEPRIHYALVCAAVSCPPLLDEPYEGDRLDAQLDERARTFLSGEHGLQIDRAAGRVYLSSIFDWFGEDWEQAYPAPDKYEGKTDERAILGSIAEYLDSDANDYLEAGDYSVKYLDYDWSLNSQR